MSYLVAILRMDGIWRGSRTKCVLISGGMAMISTKIWWRAGKLLVLVVQNSYSLSLAVFRAGHSKSMWVRSPFTEKQV